MRENFNPQEFEKELQPLVAELKKLRAYTHESLYKVIKRFTKPNKNIFSKSEVLAGYKYFGGTNQKIINALVVKPTRTLSGVMPVTVLTKPFPCPGKCIFCPNDIRMPKSYISSEPGAQRAEKNFFDPYLQTYNRLLAYKHMGHPVDKAEVIVLGGTWSFYPEAYQIWYIKRIFEALNDFGENKDQRAHIAPSIDVTNVHATATHYNSTVTALYHDQEMHKQPESATWKELEYEQKRNETATVRCIGLVLETRPDYISEAEVEKIRRFGATKTQIGLQSLQDSVLEKNHRGHDVAASRKALALLRQAGFKIHAHWMPNLYGSNPNADKADYHTLFADPDFKPDELKIYPCSLIPNTELVQEYEKGNWQPYTKAELLDVLSYCLKETPRYCRLTRVIRDIPGDEIMVGNKITNFRQLAEKEAGRGVVEIRAREIKGRLAGNLTLKDTVYETSVSTEHFLEWVTKDDQIVGFLRLSLPKTSSFLEELAGSALIREVHVYGQSVAVGEGSGKAAQHLGLGKKLIQNAWEIAAANNYKSLAVISAIGTREYYRKIGFIQGKLYQSISLG